MNAKRLIELFGEGTEEVEEVAEWPVATHMDIGKSIELAREYERRTGQRLDKPTKKT